MSINLVPYETCNLPTEIQKELERRKRNYGLKFQDNTGWGENNKDWEKYKGPMVSWTRVCSNGMGQPTQNKPGFIIQGGKDFFKTYGFKTPNSIEPNQQVIGYTPKGVPHVIENDIKTSDYPIHVPTPEIVKVETVMQKELFRRAWIQWRCFSYKQLEYMTPYFLVPGISMVVEFGWNHFNFDSLIDLSDEDKLADYFYKNPYPLYKDNVLNSNGNYDVVYGIISNFEWAVEGNAFICTTEVTSNERLYAGLPISVVVAEKQNFESEQIKIHYFSSLKALCETNLIDNIKSIALADTLEEAEKNNVNKTLIDLIKGTGDFKPMKKEYYRGVFFGRNDKLMEKSKNNLRFEWTVKQEGDFDYNGKDVWVNMGFLVELMNRSFPMPSPSSLTQEELQNKISEDTVRGFFHVDVEQSVIGAHPNLISTDGTVLLIPNAEAPKYMYGDIGMAKPEFEGEKNDRTGYTSDYINQYLDEEGKIAKTIKLREKNNDDLLWNADVQLCNVFKQFHYPKRDDLDDVINGIRYMFPTERISYSFPFLNVERVKIKNREESAWYDPHFYGYFKDLYFNLNKFVSLVQDERIKTYEDLYKVIFEEINRSAGNFWDLALVVDQNTNNMVVTDKKMVPSGNNKSKVLTFDYMDANSIIQSLGFKPKMTEAQASRVMFAENNNQKAVTVIKDENDLLNYHFKDRILSRKDIKSPTVAITKNTSMDPFKEQIKYVQSANADKKFYQFSVMVGDKPFFRRLALPDSQLLRCLLDDQDFDRNQTYCGIQPNITLELGMQGIGGFRTFMSFLIRNLPKPYSHKDVVFRIVDVQHILQNGKWDMIVKAGLLPLRDYIKKNLMIED